MALASIGCSSTRRGAAPSTRSPPPSSCSARAAPAGRRPSPRSSRAPRRAGPSRT
uniref:Uncharacterized protein n=1 Tax=Arundo donax TaxID=35708 RepID=A0A0A9FGA5_ARUDO